MARFVARLAVARLDEIAEIDDGRWIPKWWRTVRR